MKILYDTTNGSTRPYPRADGEPVIDLDPRYLSLTVIEAQPPAYDQQQYRLVRNETADLQALTYTISWDAEPLPPEAPVARWVQFGVALGVDPAVNQLVGTVAQVAPVLHLMLGVGLGQAAQGDPKTFMAAWTQARQAGLVSSELASAVAEMAESFDLPSDFVASLAA